MRKQKQNSPQNLFLFPLESYENIGFWVWHPEKDVISASDNIYSLYNIKNKKFSGSLKAFLELVNADGKNIFTAKLANAVRSKERFVYNEILSDRENKQLQTLGMPLLDYNGNVDQVVAACIDISNNKKLENEIKESFELNQRLLENTNSLIILQDKDYRIIYANSNAVFASGAPDKSFILGNTVEKYLDPKDLMEMYQRFNKVIKSGKPSDPKLLNFITWDKKIMLGESRMFPFDYQGKRLVLTIIQDVSETRNLYEALKTSEAKLKKLITEAPVALAMFNNNMDYLGCSKKYLEDWWIKNDVPNPDDIMGKNHYSLFSDVPEKWKKAHSEALRGKVVKNDEDYFIKTNGKREWLRWEIRPWYEKEDQMGGIMLFSEFITEKKENELLLYENEARQVTLLSNLPGVVFNSVNDEKRSLTYLSNTAFSTFGYDHKYFKVKRLGLNDIIYKQDLLKIEKAISNALLERKSYNITYRIKTPVKTITVNERGQGIYSDNGKVKSIEGVIFDISDQKKAEKEKDDLAKRNNALIKAIPDLMLIFKKDGTFVDIEEGDANILNTPKEKLLGTKIKEHLPTPLYKKFKKEIKKALKSEITTPFEYSFKIGKARKFFEARIVRYKKDKALCIIRDITRLKEQEQQAIMSEEKFYKAFHLSPIPVAIVDIKSGEIFDMNDQFCQLASKDLEEMKGSNIDVLHFWQDHQDKKSFLIKLMRNGRVAQYDTILKVNGQDIKNIVISAETVEVNHRKAALLMFFDLTERKKVENDLINLTEELRASNEELKQFAYITSHNFRAPVVNIESLLEFYNKVEITDPDNLVIIDNIERSVKQLKETLNDLIDLVALKDGIYKKSSIIFQQVIDRVSRSLEKSIRETEAKIVTHLQVKSILFKKPILESIFYNLISNAIKYKKPLQKPIITINTYRNGDEVILTIEDNGMGIDLNKNSGKLFGLYQRLHNSGEGKGLGLYIVKNQIENMGGKIEVQSTVGTGTKFFVSFPD